MTDLAPKKFSDLTPDDDISGAGKMSDLAPKRFPFRRQQMKDLAVTGAQRCLGGQARAATARDSPRHARDSGLPERSRRGAAVERTGDDAW